MGNPYTERELQQIVKLWPRHTVAEIGRRLKRSRFSILYIADRMRQEGADLPPKQATDSLSLRIRRALEPLSTKKN